MMRANERGISRTAEVIPQSSGARRPLPPMAWAAGVALLALSAAGVFAGHRQLDGLVSQLDGQALPSAPKLLDRILEQRKANVLAEVRLLSEDTRVRTTVMTAKFSEATVRDILEDLQGATGASVLAVLDPRGKIQALAGKESLRALDVGATPALAQALAKPVGEVWMLPDQVLVAGLAPVRAGGQVAALLLVAREVDATTLTMIEESLGVSSALLVRGKIVARSAGAASLEGVVKAAAGLEEGRRKHVVNVGGQHLVRVAPASQSSDAGQVVWMLPRAAGEARLAKLRALVWMPVPLVALALALAVSLFRRRSPGEVA